MRNKAEAREFKRQQLIALKGGNEKAPEVVRSPNHPMSKNVEPEKPNACIHCNGTGSYTGLFKADVCATCNGCGFDISDPMKVIEWQAAQLSKARVLYKKVAGDYSDLLKRYGVQKYMDEQLLKAVRGKDLKGRLD